MCLSLCDDMWTVNTPSGARLGRAVHGAKMILTGYTARCCGAARLVADGRVRIGDGRQRPGESQLSPEGRDGRVLR